MKEVKPPPPPLISFDSLTTEERPLESRIPGPPIVLPEEGPSLELTEVTPQDSPKPLATGATNRV